MLSTNAKPSLKLTATNALLVGNAFVWYLLVFKTLGVITDQIDPSQLSPLRLLVFGVNACSIAIFAFLGSFAIDKLKQRKHFLNVWMLLGVVVSLVPLALDMSIVAAILGISILFGAYFGIGMPMVMGYFSAHTIVENRAKVSGITFLLIGILFAILGFFIIGNILIACLILSGIRLAGVLLFRWSNVKELPSEESTKSSYRSIISNRGFLFFLVSWLMVSLVNYMTIPIQNVLFASSETFGFLTFVVEPIIMAFSAIICGFVADVFGRKRITILGFVMLGIGYAFLGLFPDWHLSSYFYIAADGIAWGIFNIVFLLIIWGDLAQFRKSDKFYVLGALPYVFSNFLRLLFAHYVPDVSNLPIFSFASVFLFLAVLPLLYAPETLSEKLMKDRDLKSYVEKAKRKAQKESERNGKEEEQKDAGLEESQNCEDDEDYKEALKLAEKYY